MGPATCHVFMGETHCNHRKWCTFESFYGYKKNIRYCSSILNLGGGGGGGGAGGAQLAAPSGAGGSPGWGGGGGDQRRNGAAR
eukprot:SAG31_NODE_3861_length_3812_cov_4.053865_1_plen_82_part_10